MPNLRTLRLCAWMAGAVAVAAGAAHVGLAQTYPNRVIKIIVPFAVGGQPDTVARVFAQHLAMTLGPTIVDNRPGNNTTLGAKAAASADPDGYTLLFGTSTSLAIAPATTPNAGYDPVKSFAPIVAISSSPMFLTVGPSVPSKSIGEFVAHAKANPGKLNFASPSGGPPHISGEMFKRAVGIDIVPIFYRTMNQAITDLIAGQMDIVFDSPAPLAHLIREGKIRALVAMSARRSPQLAEVPTMAESGLPDLQVTTWNGLVAPAGTPNAIVMRLNAIINDALKSPDIRETLSRFSSDPIGGTPQEFADFIAVESKKWAETIRAAGIKAE
jgi:tripartite-type tricarboxylate transporter receptor subunit TctC